MTTSISEMARLDEERAERINKRVETFKAAELAANTRFERDNRRGDYMEGFLAGVTYAQELVRKELGKRLEKVLDKGCE